MKIRILMNTPDCLLDATEDLSEDDRLMVKELASRWFNYGETVKLELDTEKETLVVVR